ncbi:MAG TPA: hypothetical protein VF300_02660, partial [Methanothrix sp.]
MEISIHLELLMFLSRMARELHNDQRGETALKLRGRIGLPKKNCSLSPISHGEKLVGMRYAI